MLDVYSSLFGDMNQQIPYAVWKGIHHLKASLQGELNIDVLVALAFQEQFQELMDKHGFVSAEYEYLQFPFVAHYFGYDENSGRIAHLHIYYQIVTGESHLKSYHIPLAVQFLNRRFLNEYGVYQLSFRDQALIYTIRHYTKRADLIGYLLWLREKNDYIEEYEFIKNGVMITDEEQTSIADGVWAEFDFWQLNLESNASGYFDARSQVACISKYRRFNQYKAIVYSIRALFTRFMFKLFRTKKRVDKGLVFAISGVDGSGKSSLIRDLTKWLQKDFAVTTIHLGRPTPTFLTLFLHPLLYFHHTFKDGSLSRNNDSRSAGVKSIRSTSIFFSIRQLALAYERQKLAQKARYWAGNGQIVLSDRYPSNSDNKMDSPRIGLDGSSFVGVLAKVERSLYRDTPKADVILWLDVTLENVINRNRERTKEQKENDTEIAFRYKNNQRLDFCAEQTVIIDANRDYDTVLKGVKQILWSHLHKKQHF